jgi:N-acetyl-anhydromuramyl-L-alanine amidase AmpD
MALNKGEVAVPDKPAISPNRIATIDDSKPLKIQDNGTHFSWTGYYENAEYYSEELSDYLIKHIH